jgi:myo-inositol-1(or 4)-monophosphatase
MYSGIVGQGAWLDDRPLHVLTTSLNESSLLMLTSNLNLPGGCPAWASRWISQTDWKIRILGSAALDTIQVAAGVAHGAITINGKIWDVVAPAAVLLGAGGKISDLAGKPIFPFDLNGYTGAKVPFLAGAPAAHGVLVKELRE